MATPTLSKKQQKKSFSSKKTPVKGLRNVLSQPYDFFWPIIRDDDSEENINELKALLEEFMPAMKRPSIDIPWSHLHKLGKNERRVVREEARSKIDSSMPDRNISNSVVTGINGVTRLLEKNDAACVLLEANVEPMLLIKHIVTMAELNDVPVIVVNILKSVMLETVGFASAAVALKKTVAQSENHHFNKLYKKVVQLARNFDAKRMTLKLEYEKPVDNDSLNVEVSTIESIKDKEDKEEKRSDSFKLSSDVYLYRNSINERIFVPANARSETTQGMAGVDFIRIANDSDSTIDDDNIAMSKTKTRYVDFREKATLKPKDIKNEFISLNADPKFSATLFDNELNVDDDSLRERKTHILGLSNDNSPDFKSKKSFQVKKNRNVKIKYQSLRVKRIQGNVKRAKATKVPKRNRK